MVFLKLLPPLLFGFMFFCQTCSVVFGFYGVSTKISKQGIHHQHYLSLSPMLMPCNSIGDWCQPSSLKSVSSCSGYTRSSLTNLMRLASSTSTSNYDIVKESKAISSPSSISNKLHISTKNQVMKFITIENILQSTKQRKDLYKRMPSDINVFLNNTVAKYKNDPHVDIPKIMQEKKFWWVRFEELYNYYILHGETNNIVSTDWESDEKLAIWVYVQRMWHRAHKEDLHPNNNDNDPGNPENAFRFNNTYFQTRYALLNEIDFQWNLCPRFSLDPKWLENFINLCDYVCENGHADVPRTCQTLGIWVNTQRRWYRQVYMKKKKNLHGNETDAILGAAADQERVDLLESIGFKWTLKGSSKTPNTPESWYQRYKELVEFKKRFGNVDVPNKWEENKKLGLWVSRQRKWYRLKTNEQGRLIDPNAPYQKRIDKLNALGFDWNPSRKKRIDDWLGRYCDLKAFAAENGHCNVPSHYPPDKQLGLWVHQQRQWYCNSIVKKQTRRQQLRELSIAAQNCDDTIEHLYHYNYTEGRGSTLDESITQKRIGLLNEIGFNWTLKETTPSWDDRYQELVEFYKEHGHSNVPPKWEQNHALAVWVRSQRSWYRKHTDANGNLHDPADANKQKRISLMNKIDFKWKFSAKRTTTSIHPAWTKNYNNLCDYVNRFGHTIVPSKLKGYETLSSWVARQRLWYKTNKRNGQLEQDLIMQQMVNKLNSINFQWAVHGRAHWWTMYNKLVLYHEKYNTCRGLELSSEIRQDLELYQFVMKLQRNVREYYATVTNEGTAYNIYTKQLSKDRIEALRRIDFCWLPEPIPGPLTKMPPTTKDCFVDEAGLEDFEFDAT